MEKEVFELLRDKLDSIDASLHDLSVDLKSHVSQDQNYWREIDRQNAQISLLKWLFGGSIAATIAAVFSWMAAKLGIR